MKRKITLIPVILTAVFAVSCENLYNDAADVAANKSFHGTKQFIASDGAAGDNYGRSIALSADGRTVVVGAYWGDGAVVDSGRAFVYRWNGDEWNEMELTITDLTAGDKYGISVDISADGKTVIVGADLDDDKGANAGAAYIFKWNGNAYNFFQKLTANDGAPDDYFGYDITISGDGNTIIASSYLDDDKGSDAGSAYFYRRDGASYIQVAKLTASDGEAGDNFGHSVAVSYDGSTAVIGSSDDDSMRGAAYVISWNGSSFVESQKITASDGVANDFFGYNIDISTDGKTIAVSAYKDDSMGSAYIYKLSGLSYVQTQKLTADDRTVDDIFAAGIAITSNGNSILLGSSGDDDNGNDSGSIYLFNLKESGYIQTKKITASDSTTGDSLGLSVAISEDGSTIVSSVYLDDIDNNADQGSVWLYAE